MKQTKAYPDLDAFTAETGIEVELHLKITTTTTKFYAKYKPLLDKGQSLGSRHCVRQLIGWQHLWIQEWLCHRSLINANIPNIANLNEAYRNASVGIQVESFSIAMAIRFCWNGLE